MTLPCKHSRTEYLTSAANGAVTWYKCLDCGKEMWKPTQRWDEEQAAKATETVNDE